MVSGLLLIDKPAGISSFEVVRRVRHLLKGRKVGHLGTLDPFATGLLPLVLGEATKLTPFLMTADKTYLAVVKLGEETDTQDRTGKVVARWEQLPGPQEIRQVAARFVGKIEQIPPLYSAVHFQGERLYKLARQGKAVQPQPRQVVVYRLEIREIALPQVTLEVTCSKGTYIRTLAADLGRALGCGAHLVALRRLAVGPWRVDEALPFHGLDKFGKEDIRPRLIPLAECLPALKPVCVGPTVARSLSQGRMVPAPGNGLEETQQVRVLAGGQLVAVATVRQRAGQLVLAPRRVFRTKAWE
jgi:tRNA pseudouridine55 synthase